MFSQAVVGLLKEWQEYLKLQKNYSIHTQDVYFNDVQNFLSFMTEYLAKTIELCDIANVDKRFIRSWLAKCHADGYLASSTARALSSVKNFYKFSEKNTEIKSHELYQIKSPKKAKTLPKALSEEQLQTSIAHIDEFSKKNGLNSETKLSLFSFMLQDLEYLKHYP